MRSSPLISFLLYVVSAMIIMSLFHLEFISSWLSQSLPISEDGLKNLYTLDYHVQHGDSLLWFEGMNYPWGEHVVYTDNQPIIAWLLQLIHSILPINVQTTLITLIFLGFAIGGWFLFSILRSLNSPAWLPFLGSIGIMLLTPQWMRTLGHYSLAYGFAIPMILWFVFRWQERQDTLNMILPSIAVLMLGFIHPYLMVMSSAFLILFFVAYNFANPEKTSAWQWTKSIGVGITPILLFQIIMALTDPIADRPEAPYGFLVYRATWASVFTPIDLPHGYWLATSLGFENASEGGLYIGLFALIGIMLGFFLLLQSRNSTHIPIVVRVSFLALLATIPILLLSLGFPFTIEGFDRFLPYTGPLQQFRGIGRFAFTFFYAGNLFALVALTHWLSTASKLRTIISAFLILILFAEGFSMSNRIGSGDRSLAMGHDWDSIEIGDETAILSIPFFHTGSENFRALNAEEITRESFLLSQRTGLPLLAVQMSRTSLGQTLKSIQLVGEPLEIPSIAKDHEDESWLLLIDNSEPLETWAQKLVNRSKMLSTSNVFSLYSIHVSEFAALHEESKAFAQSVQENNEPVDQDGLNEVIDGFYIDGFEDQDSSTPESNQLSFIGKSARISRIDWTPLFPARSVLGQDTFELSFWVYAAEQHAVNTQIWFWERNGETELDFRVSEIGDHVSAVVGDWVFVTYPIISANAQNDFEVLLHRDGENMDIWIDEVMLRRHDLNVWRTGSLNANNRYYKPSSRQGVI